MGSDYFIDEERARRYGGDNSHLLRQIQDLKKIIGDKSAEIKSLKESLEKAGIAQEQFTVGDI